MDQDNPINDFLRIVLALNVLVEERTGTEPLLSNATYSYAIPIPAWDWDEIGRAIERVEPTLDGLPQHRAAYLRDCLAAYALMVREGQGDDIPYAERVATYLQVPGERVADAVIEALERDLRTLLVDVGYPDDLSVGIPQWREDKALRRDELVKEAQSLLRRAREETGRRVSPLPKEHTVALSFPNNYPSRGHSDYYCDYQGRVFLNGDIGWEMASLKHYVCHEVFPGHQAFSALREQQYRAGALPVEGTVYFANTPMTPIVEGICEVGQEMVGMLETVDDHIFDSYNRLAFAVGTNLAFDCNADGMDQETAVAQLMNAGHVSRVLAEIRYHFWTNPLWCTSFPHYWYGREFVRESYERMKEHLPTFYEMVYKQPHSVRSLREEVERHLEQAES